MDGSFWGGVLAVLYFLLFQCAGLVLSCSLLRGERTAVRLLLGCTGGTVLLMWLPALWAFLFGFTPAAHAMAAATALLGAGAVVLFRRPKLRCVPFRRVAAYVGARPDLLLPFSLWLLFAFLCFHGFRYVDGAVWSSQCTWGDMSMHLGFITSIAGQGTFPPTYSILPDAKLAYPFLSDSISASLYLLGAPLRLAYLLPMVFAGGVGVFFGAWLLFGVWLHDRAKRIVAAVLFFLNGGFGFAYFLGGLENDPGNFTRIFTAFYETPTNLLAQNVRWVNVIVDILVPQRASLFGWAVLFPLLYLLFRAVFQQKTRYFPLIGVLAGSMVMIHTHSFLALGLISGGWLLFSLGRAAFPGGQKRFLKLVKWGAAALFAVPFAAQFLVPQIIPRDSALFLFLVIAAAASFALLLLALLVRAARQGRARELAGWGVYLVAAFAVAAPQLFLWTFSQASGGGFVRGWYNWGNQTDSYLWFYLVNLGVFAVVLLPALFTSRGMTFRLAAPGAVIWFICEFAVFQPNNYDNNKLLYIAFLLFCVPVAGCLVDLYRRLRGLPYRGALAAILAVFCTASALLTVGRETVAEYCLFDRAHVEAAAFLSENAGQDDTVLTDTRHNNEVASLTGRNIVCGSPSFLFYHGLDYEDRERDVQFMFADPAAALPLFAQYGVDYVMVSDSERVNYNADGELMGTVFPKVFDNGEVQIFAVEAAG